MNKDARIYVAGARTLIGSALVGELGRQGYANVVGAAEAVREYDGDEPVNLGGGAALLIAELALEIKQVVGDRGRFEFDAVRPAGMPEKLLDSSALFALGWRPRTSFRSALEETYQWFLTRERRRTGDA